MDVIFSFRVLMGSIITSMTVEAVIHRVLHSTVRPLAILSSRIKFEDTQRVIVVLPLERDEIVLSSITVVAVSRSSPTSILQQKNIVHESKFLEAPTLSTFIVELMFAWQSPDG